MARDKEGRADIPQLPLVESSSIHHCDKLKDSANDQIYPAGDVEDVFLWWDKARSQWVLMFVVEGRIVPPIFRFDHLDRCHECDIDLHLHHLEHLANETLAKGVAR